MKIVIINTSENVGGAAIAAKRLMQALNKSGQEANMLVLNKQSNNQDVFSVNNTFIQKTINRFRFTWERMVIFLNNCFNKENLFSVSIANVGNNISKHALIKEADIIHLHWINQGFISLKNIRQLIELKKPIIWTMHDMWCFTGVCHYAGDCMKYMGKCKNCPLLKKNIFDMTKNIFNQKQKIPHYPPIQFVGCSQWISNCAKKSTLLENAHITSIPNPIDINLFKAINKQTARHRFNLPLNKKLILFAAAKLSDTRKGMIYFIEACKLIASYKKEQNIEIVFFGGKMDEYLLQEMPFNKHTLGSLCISEDIVAAYSACDLFVIPSLEDNLPNTIMEAMACSVPCVGFNTGGIPEMINHKENGYIAQYKSSEDLAKGIIWCLDNVCTEDISCQARMKVEDFYTEHKVVKQYLELYESFYEKR